MSTVPRETAVLWQKPMSKQHVAAPSDVFVHEGFLALPDVPYHSSGKKPVAIVVVFFLVFMYVVNGI